MEDISYMFDKKEYNKEYNNSAKRKEYMKKYHESPKYKAATKAYRNSDEGKAYMKNYHMSSKYKEYLNSVKFKATQEKYLNSDKYTEYHNSAECKEMKKKWREKYLKSDKGKEGMKNYRMMYKYGITVEDKLKMIEAQNNKCAICKEEFKNDRDKCMDHDHETNKVRAILCAKCNVGLGNFRENQDNLLVAIEYLKKYKH